jgi:peptidoglycan/LPS O-acetylase OafA/YrhL
MFIFPKDAVFATASILLLCLPADLICRFVPFFRRELKVEAATRLTPLDGLRGLCCFGVMYHHATITKTFVQNALWIPPASVYCELLGNTSVAIFFCITGFLFWSRALARNGDIPMFAFFRGRWFRMIPLYLFTCTVVLWISRKHIHWHNPDTHWGLARMALMGLNGWGLLFDFDPGQVNAGVVWSLQFEWIFYMVLPVVAPVVRGGGWRIILLFIAMKGMSGWMNPPEITWFFLIGIAAAQITLWRRTAAVLRSPWVAPVVLAVLVSMPLILTSGYGTYALLMTSAVFIPIACGNTLFGILTLPGFRMMGMVSYSVYLLHGIFLYTNRPMLKLAEEQGDMTYWLHVFALACCVLVCCSFTYRFIEWPFMELEKKIRRRGTTPRRVAAVEPAMSV